MWTGLMSGLSPEVVQVFFFLLLFSNDVLLQFQIPYSLYPVHQKKKKLKMNIFER